MGSVFVFSQMGGNSPGGVFSTRENAETWIQHHQLTGVLSVYPLDVGVFDWAAQEGLIKAHFIQSAPPDVIAGFCSHLEHYHYRNGEMIA